VCTHDNPTDMMTKVVTINKFRHCKLDWCVQYLVEPFRGIRARQRDSVPVDKENSSQGKDLLMMY